MQQKKPNKTEHHKPKNNAEAACGLRNLRLTRVRRVVLEFLHNAGMPVKAYDILDALRHDVPKALTPASIYRALDYLLQEGLVHKVGTLNAYVACTETCPDNYTKNGPTCSKTCPKTCTPRHAPVFMLVCPGCRQSREISDPGLYQTIFSTMQQQGFLLRGDTVELTGICPGCAQQQTSTL